MKDLIASVLRSLPADALEARLALSIVAAKLGVDLAELKGVEDGAPTVSRHHAKEHE